MCFTGSGASFFFSRGSSVFPLCFTGSGASLAKFTLCFPVPCASLAKDSVCFTGSGASLAEFTLCFTVSGPSLDHARRPRVFYGVRCLPGIGSLVFFRCLVPPWPSLPCVLHVPVPPWCIPGRVSRVFYGFRCLPVEASLVFYMVRGLPGASLAAVSVCFTGPGASQAKVPVCFTGSGASSATGSGAGPLVPPWQSFPCILQGPVPPLAKVSVGFSSFGAGVFSCVRYGIDFFSFRL